MSLTNVAYLGRYTWANHLLAVLETQAVVPMFGSEPDELLHDPRFADPWAAP